MALRSFALLFFLCTFLLTSGGRLGSVDAGSQLQATLLGLTTGSLGSPAALPPEPLLWVQSPNGLFYQCHDYGNLVLMAPAALLARSLSQGASEDLVRNPPPLARVAVSLTYAAVAALGSFFLFLAFQFLYGTMASLGLAAVFSFATFYWAYSKTAWDVMGSAVGVCLLLYGALKIQTKNSSSPLDFALLGFAVAWAGAFRCSLLPSLVLGGGYFLWSRRERIGAKAIAALLVVLIAGILPTLIYNHVRMGSPFRPATMAFPSTSDLQGNLLYGLFGLLLSPNKGLVWFAPIFCLLALLPAQWKKQSKESKTLGISLGLVVISYLLLISKIRNWGTFGWGPRYVVPILPLLFYFLAPLLVDFRAKYPRWAASLVLVSFLLNFAPVAVNWSLALADPIASDPHLATPQAHLKVWRALFDGIAGKPLSAPPEVLADPVRSAGARFPDLWLVRLMELGAKETLAGVLMGLLLIAGFRQSLVGLAREAAAKRI